MAYAPSDHGLSRRCLGNIEGQCFLRPGTFHQYGCFSRKHVTAVGAWRDPLGRGAYFPSR